MPYNPNNPRPNQRYAKRRQRGVTTIEHLPECFVPEPNTGCWLWERHSNRLGYGRIRHNGEARQAHRVSFELRNGPVPAGMFVCHRCDTPSCINPDHLFLGTPADNCHDMIRKGRQVTLRGENAAGAKLTNDQVRAIRTVPRYHGVCADLGRRYGVHESHISRIRSGKKFWAAA